MMARFFAESAALWGIAVLLGILTAWLHPKAPQLTAPADPLAISAEQVDALAGPYLLMDAREREAFEADRLEGAVLLNEAEWDLLIGEFLLEYFEPETTYIVYCDGGGCEASKSIVERLRADLPGIEAYFLEGGMQAYSDGGGLR